MGYNEMFTLFPRKDSHMPKNHSTVGEALVSLIKKREFSMALLLFVTNYRSHKMQRKANKYAQKALAASRRSYNTKWVLAQSENSKNVMN